MVNPHWEGDLESSLSLKRGKAAVGAGKAIEI